MTPTDPLENRSIGFRAVPRAPVLLSFRDLRLRGYNPADLLFVGYAAVACVVLAAGALRGSPSWDLLAAHLGVLILSLSMRFVARRGPAFVQFLRESYALWFIPVAYGTLDRLNRVFTHAYFDDVVLRWDRAVFGRHLNADFQAWIPVAPLREFLHFNYFIYALLIPALGLTLFFQRRFEAFRVFATTVVLTLYGCFLVFIFFPVQGPYYTFPRFAGDGIFPALVHAVLDRQSSIGSAFPSSHVAVSTVVAVMAWRYSRRFSYAFISVAASIFLATIYGGFHYALDSVCGLVFGLAMGLTGPRLHSVILRRARIPEIHLRFPHLRFRWMGGRIRGQVVRARTALTPAPNLSLEKSELPE